MPTLREDRAWQTTPVTVGMLAFIMVMLALIMTLFTSFTNNLDEIKPTLQFVFLPLAVVGFFYLLMRGEAAPPPRVVWIPFAAFFGILVLSSLLAQHAWRAWFTVGWYWTAVTPFLVITTCVKSERQFHRFAVVYVALGLAVVLFGLFHYAGGVGWLMRQVYPIDPTGRHRLYELLYTLSNNTDMFSTFLNTDFYAAYLVMLFPIAVNLAMAPFRNWAEPALGLVTALLAGVSVIFTESNDSQAAIFLIVLFYFFTAVTIGHVLAKKHDVLWAFVIGGAVVLATLFTLYSYRLIPQFRTMDLALSSRVIIYRGGWEMFLDHPLLGAGPGAFLLLFPNYRADNYFEHEISNVTLYAHNMYLGLLSEEGLVGFLVYMFFLGAVVGVGLRQIRRPGSYFLRTHQIGLVAGILGVSIQNAFSPNARWTVCAVNYWTLLGLSVSCAMLGLREEQRERAPNAPPPRLLRLEWGRAARPVAMVGLAVSILVALVMAPFGYNYFAAAYHNNEGIIATAEGTRFRRPDAFRAATRHFERAIERWPGFITSFYKQAHAYSMLQDFDAALRAYRRLAEYAPQYSEIHYNLGVVHRLLAAGADNEPDRVRHMTESLQAFERARKVAQKVNVQRAASHAYLIAAREMPVADEQREEWLDRAIEIHYRVCMRYFRDPEDRAAQAELRRQVARQLWDAATLVEKDENREDRGEVAARYRSWQIDVARKLVEENDEEDEILISRMVESMRRNGRHDEAEAYLIREIERDPASVLFHHMLGNHYIERKRHRKAAEVFAGIARLVAAGDGLELRLPSSRARWKAAARTRSDHRPEAFMLQAMAEAHRGGEISQAREYARQILEMAPQSDEARRARALLTMKADANTSPPQPLSPADKAPAQ